VEVAQSEDPVAQCATHCAAGCASGSARSGPRTVARKPKSARGKDLGLLEEEPPPLVLPDNALAPLCQTRLCVVGLMALGGLRGLVHSVYAPPAGLAWTAHMLSCAADVIAMLGSLPVLVTRSIGSCVHHRCLGSLLTLLLTATVCDFGAVVIFLSTAGGIFQFMGPVATDEGAPAALAFIGVWECILLSSIALEIALCTSAWKFYRAFREAGIYPPSSANVKVHPEVSPLEFLCEAEDVALLSDQCVACVRSSAVLEESDGSQASSRPSETNVA
jgi:hypothetical protein